MPLQLKLLCTNAPLSGRRLSPSRMRAIAVPCVARIFTLRAGPQTRTTQAQAHAEGTAARAKCAPVQCVFVCAEA